MIIGNAAIIGYPDMHELVKRQPPRQLWLPGVAIFKKERQRPNKANTKTGEKNGFIKS